MDDFWVQFGIVVFGTIIVARLVAGLFVTAPILVILAMLVAGVCSIPVAYLYASNASGELTSD